MEKVFIGQVLKLLKRGTIVAAKKKSDASMLERMEKAIMQELSQNTKKMRGKAKKVETWVKKNPLLAIGAAFVLGYLIGRARRR